MTIWKRIKRYFPFIGILLFIYLLIRLNLIEVIKQVKNSNLYFLLIALIFTFLYFLIQTIKWYIIARKQKIKIPFKEAFKINLFCNFYGLVTPGRLGSIIRADYLKRYSNSVGKGLSNFVIDKVLDLSSLFFLAIILGLIVLREKIGIAVINYLIILFLVMVFVFLIFYSKDRSKFLLNIVYRKLVPKNMKKKAKMTFNSFYKDLPRKRFLIMVFIYNLIAWITNYFAAYLIALSLGIKIGFIYFLAIYPIATLVAQIPITISGLGTREFTLIGLFGLYGVEAVKIFSMSIIGIFIMEILPALISIFLLFKKTKFKRKNEIYNLEESRQES